MLSLRGSRTIWMGCWRLEDKMGAVLSNSRGGSLCLSRQPNRRQLEGSDKALGTGYFAEQISCDLPVPKTLKPQPLNLDLIYTLSAKSASTSGWLCAKPDWV